MKITGDKLFGDYNKKLQLELVKKQLEIQLITTNESVGYMKINNDIKLLKEH